MSNHGEELNAEHLHKLFQELSESLQTRGLHAQIFVVGGAAMALAYDRQRMTRDVDALFEPASEVRDIAAEMADSHGLEPDWLNDGAKGFMPATDEHPRTVFESDSMLVQVPSPEYLLAMKLHASRGERDLNDAAILYNKARYIKPQEGIDLLRRSYPSSMLLPKHRYVVEEVAERAEALRELQQTGRRLPTRDHSARQAAKLSELGDGARQYRAQQGRGSGLAR
ncbi:MAG: DUF6036 family nucleotidyltransferase [Rhodoglobus sp.]